MSSPIDNTWPNPPCASLSTLEQRKFQEDANGDVCVNVCISEPTGSAFKCVYESGNNAPGSEYCFLSCPIDIGKTFNLEQIIVAFQQSGLFLVKVDGNTIMRLITSPAQPTIDIKLSIPKPISEGETVEICFCSTEPGEYSANLIGSIINN